MAPKTSQKWGTEFDTVRRQKLFQNPPTDRTAYPALVEAIKPHIQSFNAILERGGILESAIKDIGTKVFLDGDPYIQPESPRNRLSVRIREVFLEPPLLPSSNKYALNTRRVMPAEARERHGTYRGRLTVRLEYRVNNGEWFDEVREMGQVPIMLKASFQFLAWTTISNDHSQIAAIWKN
jgi:DNA-directed RNA polymerase I subunit RPA2